MFVDLHNDCRYLSSKQVLRLIASRGAGIVTVMLLVALLGGCAWMRANLLSPVPADRRHVVLLSSAPLTVVGGQRYTGAGQKQDYLLLGGDAGQAELVYVHAVNHQNEAALQYYGSRLREFNANWAVNAGGIHDWRHSQLLTTPLASFVYVSYTPGGQQDRECAAFQALWDVLPGDPYQRPRKLIFGYYCAHPGASLDAGTLQALLASLRVGFYTGADRQAMAIPVLQARPTDSDADTGYRGFPELVPVYRRPLFALE